MPAVSVAHQERLWRERRSSTVPNVTNAGLENRPTAENAQLDLRPIRIVSWNCSQGLARKAAALLALQPDIAVVPESSNGGDLEGLSRVGWAGRNPAKGLSVFARPDLGGVVDPAWDEIREWFLPVRFATISLDVLAVWAMNHRGAEPGPRLGRTHRAIDNYATFLRPECAVVIGDFNDNARWDTARQPMFATTTRMLADLGYANVYHGWTGETSGAETGASLLWQHNADKRYLVDHAFIPRRWMPRVRDFRLGEVSEWLPHSDHVPLILDLDVPANGPSRQA